MSDAKLASSPFPFHSIQAKGQCSTITQEKDLMPKVPYASSIRSLMYDMVCTRLDITHAVRVVCRYMSNHGKQHQKEIKWILRYFWGTTEKCLCFKRGELKLHGYVDADFAGSIDDRRSTTGYLFTLENTSFSWASQLQQIVSLSTTEAKYVAMTEASKQLIWLQGLLA